jgi:hypothetical protein
MNLASQQLGQELRDDSGEFLSIDVPWRRSP